MLTLGEAFYDLKAALGALYDNEEASAIAHEVLQHLTGKSKLERLSQKEAQLSATQWQRFLQLRSALQSGAPLQYALGEAYFMGRRFSVSPAVLIPRPETEELVQWIISQERPQTLLDIGTGSGCIAISLKLALANCVVTAIDVSQTALEVAEKNARDLCADVHFEQLNFLDEQARSGLPGFDVIVSNPPYIPETERETLHTNVRDYEPETALFVPSENALLFYQQIAVFGKIHLNSGGSIYCELHQDYAEQTTALFRTQGYNFVTLRRDIHGNLRMLQAKP